MLMLRLQRIGKTKSPSYRLIVSEKQKDTQAGALEILGQYDPTKNPKIINFKEDRIKHWLSVGAQCSNTVHNLLVKAGIITGEKQKSVYISKKRAEKINAKKADKAGKAQEAGEAKSGETKQDEADEAPVEPRPEAEKPNEEAVSDQGPVNSDQDDAKDVVEEVPIESEKTEEADEEKSAEEEEKSE